MNANNKLSCVYGGSFDPPTNGHYHLVKKAATIFDSVYVVLAENTNKKSKAMFTDKERLAMLQDMANSIGPTHVKVSILPQSSYLANFAYELGAGFLIRGIRDQLDFGYEQNIYRTNRYIQPNIETIYLMPDDAYSLVSSSWIKGLIGCNDWTNVIKDSVTPFVLNELKKRFLKDKFLDLVQNTSFRHFVMQGREDNIWKEICKHYEDKDYHGFDHLINFFEALYTYNPNPDPIMVYSVFMHDINPSEEKSAQIANSFLRMISRTLNDEGLQDRITRLIMATKHNTCIYDKEDEQIIASIDLLVLAKPSTQYEKYVKKVFNEYLKASGKTREEFLPGWQNGRMKFLKKMLDRKVIFPSEKFRNMDSGECDYCFERIARANMTTELNILKEQSKIS